MSATSLLAALFVDVRLHHEAADAGGFAAAAPAGLVEEHRDRGERAAVLHREPDEPAVLLGGLAIFGRTGLAADVVAVDLRVLARAVLHDAEHHVLQVARDLRVDRLTGDLGLRLP